MIKESERLYRLGLALHWLHPKSKRPIESKWTTGARKEFPALKASYREGMNLGVRLGKASKVGDGFLAVIDCDVKSADPRHQEELREKIKELFPGLTASAPTVLSGRGNGSAHIYFRTSEPTSTKRLSQSSETVRVKMPSASKPSRAELAALSESEIAEGIRLRPAWEIMVLGEGSQVVLPPSVHPDTGERYAWREPFKSIAALPFLTVASMKRAIASDEPSSFRVAEVDMEISELPEEMIELVRTGSGCADRSAALFTASMAMVRAGFTDDEILTILTDRTNFLGEAAYEHAKTTNRERAARWLRKYTLRKARSETDPRFQFMEEVKTEILSDDAAEAQRVELTTPEDWRAEIERSSPESGGKPKNTLKNVMVILKGEAGEAVFVKNDFSGSELYGCDTPWGGTRGAEIRDIDIIRVKDWLSRTYRFEPSNDRINEAMTKIADENRFHPVRDYLDRLEWDGKGRIDFWLKRYLSAEASDAYLRAVSRKVLVAMVKRIYEPGAKFDQVLILEGIQGVGKSTAVRTLASDAWFSDAHINVSDKDAVLSMRAVWLVELGELSGMRKADVDQLKEFISRTTDRIRLPYGKRTENFPRQCVFIGTTNADEYLRDTTGNRRFWPVKVGACDFEALKRDRDQLFAEARFAYELGEPLYLEEKEAAELAVKEQEAREESDSWVDTVRAFFASSPEENSVFNRERFTMKDVFSDFGPLRGTRDGKSEQMRAGACLRKLGFKKVTLRGEDGFPQKLWVKG